MKSLDLGKIATFAERMRARRLLNDILEQWAAFSALSKTTRESSVLALQRTMASARLRLLGNSLLTLQVVTARLTGTAAYRFPPRPEELTLERTSLVTIQHKHFLPLGVTTSVTAIDGGAFQTLNANIDKAVSDLLRIENMLAAGN
jgi:hypothetical protein